MLTCMLSAENFEREIGMDKGNWEFKKYRSPLPDGYHPEICDSPLLDPDRASFYRSMAGALQWIVTIGRVDVHLLPLVCQGL